MSLWDEISEWLRKPAQLSPEVERIIREKPEEFMRLYQQTTGRQYVPPPMPKQLRIGEQSPMYNIQRKKDILGSPPFQTQGMSPVATQQYDFEARKKQAQDFLGAMRNLPTAAGEYLQTWKGIPQQIEQQPDWQKWLGYGVPATQIFTNPIVQKGISDLTRGWQNVSTAAMGRPISQRGEEWGAEHEMTLPWRINPFTGKPATVSPWDVMAYAAPDLLLGMGAPFKMATKANVIRALAKGTREAVFETLTKTVQLGERLKPAAAEKILQVAESEIAKAAEKAAAKAAKKLPITPPVEAQAGLKAGEAVTTFDSLPMAEKVRIHTEADKIASEEIRKLDEYKKLVIKDKEWQKTHPGIATSPYYKEMIDLYTPQFDAAVDKIMAKQFPQAVKPIVTTVEGAAKGGLVPPIKPPAATIPLSDIVKPGYTPKTTDTYLKQFGDMLANPTTEKQRALTLELRSKEFAARINNFQSKVDELVANGKGYEEAVDLAKEKLTGKYPDIRNTTFDDMATEMRDVLFSKVYQVLGDDPAAQLHAVEALTNALLGKTIPRTPGIKGGSAYSILVKVFGNDPEIMKLLDKPKPLKEALEDLFLNVKSPQGVEFPLPDEFITGKLALQPSQLGLGMTPTESLKLGIDPRSVAQKQLDLQTFKTEIADLIPSEPSTLGMTPQLPETPIGGLVKREFPNMPKESQNILINVLKKIGLTIGDVGNFIRANKASGDFSFWRQQAPMIIAHPKRFVEANVKALKTLNVTGSGEAYAAESWRKITQSPLYGVYDDLGLDFLRPAMGQPGVPEWKLVEEYGYAGANRLIPKITAKLPWVKVSQRAFTTGTNAHNWGMFEDFYKMLLKVNEESALGKVKPINMKQELTKFGKMLEDLSGRGSLGKAKSLASSLSGTFFAPRMVVGRISTPRHLFSSSAFVRKEAWKNLGSFVAGVSGVILTGKQLGWWDVETDSRSSDFMKIKIGNTRLDPWGGYQQYVTFFSRAIQGSGISSTTGEEYITNPWDSLTRMARSKAAPIASVISEFWTGKTFLGEKLDITNIKQWADRVAPMAIEQLYETYTDNFAVGVATTIPSLIGAGVQTYPSKRTPLAEKQRINKLYGIDTLPKTEKLSRVETLQNQLTEDEWSNAVQFYSKSYDDRISREIADPNYIRLSDEDKKKRLNSIQSDAQDEMIRKFQKAEILKPLTIQQRLNDAGYYIESQVWSQYPPQMRAISDQIIHLENSDSRADKIQARQMLMQYPQILYARRIIAQQKALLKRQMMIQSR